MFPIDNATATASLPTPTAPGTPGFFTDGSPGSGVPATIVPAEWFNGIQQEILNVLAAASITPDKAVYNQLAAAIAAINGADLTPYETIAAAAATYTAKTDLASTATGKGASLVGFLQLGTGALARTLKDKARDVITVADYTGLDATGATDSTAAFQAALNYMATLPYGGVLKIPAGYFKLSAQLTYVGNAISIEGQGRNSSWLFWTAASATQGFSFTISSPANTFPPLVPVAEPSIRGITMQTLAVASVAAVTVTYGSPGTVVRPFTMEDAAIYSPGGSTVGNWTYGVHVLNGQEVTLRNCLILAGNVNYTNHLFLDNSTTVSAYDVRVEGCTFQGCTAASIYALGRMESLFVSDCSLEFAHSGIQCDATSVSPFSDVLSVVNSQITCQYRGIDIANWTTVYIVGTDIYSGTGSGDVGGDGIRLTTCNKVHISACKIEAGVITSISRTGITASDVTNCTISGCDIYVNAAGINLTGTLTTNWAITGNNFQALSGGTNGIISGTGLPGYFVVSGNRFIGWSTGISCQSPNFRISGNLISGCGTGVYSASSSIDARGNQMVSNTTNFTGAMRRDFFATQSLTPSAIANGAIGSTGITIAGAAIGDTVSVGPPASLGSLIAVANITAAGGGNMTVANFTGSSQTPPSGTYTFYVSN
jgi:hypothetical protein